MPEKKAEDMEQAINWPDEIGIIAGPFGGNRKSWLARAARHAGVTYRQIKALYYGEHDDPRHSVGMKLLAAAQEARIQRAKCDALNVAEFFSRHAQALASVNPDLDRKRIDEFVSAARAIGGGDRTGDSSEGRVGGPYLGKDP
ncbi:hypothetical protein IVB46_02645 [Bradyrhizobium sp. 61]|uniref:hypothetical protein n=1 Tax=Bradyrhizobium sp. 61 TaxID=2782679 RepID=UPI001FFA9E7B|nr:hypothetical protein [Bradyrhizobium sp. 61]MCK1274139.1 hypothetical protein [Bradyrhizobium sp. 61]